MERKLRCAPAVLFAGAGFLAVFILAFAVTALDVDWPVTWLCLFISWLLLVISMWLAERKR